jgi:hypothetical protein
MLTESVVELVPSLTVISKTAVPGVAESVAVVFWAVPSAMVAVGPEVCDQL